MAASVPRKRWRPLNTGFEVDEIAEIELNGSAPVGSPLAG
jgi:hypothetical protein